MSTHEPESFQTVVRAIFAERFGEASSAIGHGVEAQLLDAIRSTFPGLTDQQVYDVGFHLSDWREDAAFLLAFALEPGRFTAAEAQAGLLAFLVHAPNHVAAAAKITGWPVADIFEVGALDGESQ